nr:MAG TPA: distal tail protein [Caudoviricetes sp.]
MMHYLIYNGESSADYDLLVGAQNTFNAPKRSVTKYTIPGRNGDLIKDNGCFENISVPYTVVCKSGFKNLADSISAWLKSPTSYCRLEDSHHPEYYRMGLVTDAITYTTGALNHSAKATVTFDCKPQKWLTEGERVEKFTSAGTIFNPTKFASKPLIKVYGNGQSTLKIGDYSMSLNLQAYVTIDSELMDCTRGNMNMNSYVVLASGFPELKSGMNLITFTGGITSIEIIGRWWTI